MAPESPTDVADPEIFLTAYDPTDLRTETLVRETHLVRAKASTLATRTISEETKYERS